MDDLRPLFKELIREIIDEKMDTELGNVFVKKDQMREQIIKEIDEHETELSKKDIKEITNELIIEMRKIIVSEIKTHIAFLVGKLSKFTETEFKE